MGRNPSCPPGLPEVDLQSVLGLQKGNKLLLKKPGFLAAPRYDRVPLCVPLHLPPHMPTFLCTPSPHPSCWEANLRQNRAVEFQPLPGQREWWVERVRVGASPARQA